MKQIEESIWLASFMQFDPVTHVPGLDTKEIGRSERI
jgi:hypothetical protein